MVELCVLINSVSNPTILTLKSRFDHLSILQMRKLKLQIFSEKLGQDSNSGV